MRSLNLPIIFASIAISLSSFAAQPSMASVTVIASSLQKDKWTQEDIHNLYSGAMKPRRLELLDQAEGQTPRKEFYEKFVTDNPNQIKQQRSILVFSGERAPAVLMDDQSVFEYIKSHSNAIGYVSTSFWASNKSKPAESVELFTLK